MRSCKPHLVLWFILAMSLSTTSIAVGDAFSAAGGSVAMQTSASLTGTVGGQPFHMSDSNDWQTQTVRPNNFSGNIVQQNINPQYQSDTSGGEDPYANLDSPCQYTSTVDASFPSDQAYLSFSTQENWQVQSNPAWSDPDLVHAACTGDLTAQAEAAFMILLDLPLDPDSQPGDMQLQINIINASLAGEDAGHFSWELSGGGETRSGVIDINPATEMEAGLQMMTFDAVTGEYTVQIPIEMSDDYSLKVEGGFECTYPMPLDDPEINRNIEMNVMVVPEPASMVVLGVGAIVALRSRR